MRLLLSVILLVGASLQAAPPFTNATWGLSWDQPTNMPVLASYVPGTNQAYVLRGTATVGLPMVNWPVIAVWTNWTLITNAGAIQLSNSVTLPFAQHFLYLNPTNLFGEAPIGFFGGLGLTGPPWSTVNTSALSKLGP